MNDRTAGHVRLRLLRVLEHSISGRSSAKMPSDRAFFFSSTRPWASTTIGANSSRDRSRELLCFEAFRGFGLSLEALFDANWKSLARGSYAPRGVDATGGTRSIATHCSVKG